MSKLKTTLEDLRVSNDKMGDFADAMEGLMETFIDQVTEMRRDQEMMKDCMVVMTDLLHQTTSLTEKFTSQKIEASLAPVEIKNISDIHSVANKIETIMKGVTNKMDAVMKGNEALMNSFMNKMIASNKEVPRTEKIVVVDEEGRPFSFDKLIQAIKSLIPKEQNKILGSFIRPQGSSSGSNDVANETPSGSGTTFTLAHTPTSGTLKLYKNGARLQEGASNDYTLSGATITTNLTVASDDVLLADYSY